MGFSDYVLTKYFLCTAHKPKIIVNPNGDADGWSNENISYAWYRIDGNNAGDTVNLGFNG